MLIYVCTSYDNILYFIHTLHVFMGFKVAAILHFQHCFLLLEQYWLNICYGFALNLLIWMMANGGTATGMRNSLESSVRNKLFLQFHVVQYCCKMKKRRSKKWSEEKTFNYSEKKKTLRLMLMILNKKLRIKAQQTLSLRSVSLVWLADLLSVISWLTEQYWPPMTWGNTNRWCVLMRSELWVAQAVHQTNQSTTTPTHKPQ